MREGGFNMLLAKFSQDAQQEIKDYEKQVRENKRQVEVSRRFYRLVKFAFLCVALVGVGVGLYFSHDLGSLAGEMSFSGTPDPSLRAAPASKAKQVRKLSELRRQRDQELDEIE